MAAQQAMKPSSIVPVIGLVLLHGTPLYYKFRLLRLAPQIRFIEIVRAQEIVAALVKKSEEMQSEILGKDSNSSFSDGAEEAKDEEAEQTAGAEGEAVEQLPKAAEDPPRGDAAEIAGGVGDAEEAGEMVRVPTTTSGGGHDAEGDLEDKIVMVKLALASLYRSKTKGCPDDDKGEPGSMALTPPNADPTITLKEFKAEVKRIKNPQYFTDCGVVVVSRAALLDHQLPKVISLFCALAAFDATCDLTIDLWNIIVSSCEQGLREAIEHRDDAKFKDTSELRRLFVNATCAERYQAATAAASDPRAKRIDPELLSQTRSIIRAVDAKRGNPTLASLVFLGKMFSVATLVAMGSASVMLNLFFSIYDLFFDTSLNLNTTLKHPDATPSPNFLSHLKHKVCSVFGNITIAFFAEQARQILDNYASYRINNSARAEAAFGMLARDLNDAWTHDTERSALIDTLSHISIWGDITWAGAEVVQAGIATVSIVRHPVVFAAYTALNWVARYPYRVGAATSVVEARFDRASPKGPRLDAEELFDLTGIDLENEPERDFLVFPESVEGVDDDREKDADAAVGTSADGPEKELSNVCAAIMKGRYRRHGRHGRGQSPNLSSTPPTVGALLLYAVASERSSTYPALMTAAGAASWPAAPCDVPCAVSVLPPLLAKAVPFFDVISELQIRCVESLYAARVTPSRREKWRARQRLLPSSASAAVTGAPLVSNQDALSSRPCQEYVARLDPQSAPGLTREFRTLRAFGLEVDFAKARMISVEADEDSGLGRRIGSSIQDRAETIFDRLDHWIRSGINSSMNPPINKTELNLLKNADCDLRVAYCRFAGKEVHDSNWISFDLRDDPVALEIGVCERAMKGSSVFSELGNIATMGTIDPNTIDNTHRLLAAPTPLMRACFEELDSIPVFSIEFRDVHFHFSPEKPVLQNVNFVVQQGQFVGLVGSSGCGKSTIMSLLRRRYTPTSGRILINGKDIRSYPTRWLRRRVAYAGQDSAFGIEGVNTIEHELLLYDPLARAADLQAAVRALQKAHAYEFVMERPLGLHASPDSEFSGGEDQRLCIATALVKEASRVRCYLFDEATSALDVETERKIQRAIEDHGRRATADGTRITCIAAAHRLSTLRNCDKIIVMKRGSVAHMGTWDELMNSPTCDFPHFVNAQEVRDFGGMDVAGSAMTGTTESSTAAAELSRSGTADVKGDADAARASQGELQQQSHAAPVDENALLTAALDIENTLNELANDPLCDKVVLSSCFEMVDAVKGRFGIPPAHQHALRSKDDVPSPTSADCDDAVGAGFSLTDAFVLLPKRVNLRRNEPKFPNASFDTPFFLRFQELLPMHLKARKWAQCYSSEEVGFSLATMRHEVDVWVRDASNRISAVVLTISVAGGQTLVGAFIPTIPDWTAKRYTSRVETFVFRAERGEGQRVNLQAFRSASLAAASWSSNPCSPSPGSPTTATGVAMGSPPSSDASGGGGSGDGSRGSNEYHFKCFAEDRRFLVGGGGRGPAIDLTEDLDILACAEGCPTFEMMDESLLRPDLPGAECECGVVRVPIEKVEMWGITAEPFPCTVQFSSPAGSPTRSA